MKEIGDTIRTLRKRKRFSQADLAAKLGMSRATISGIENGTIAEIGIRKVEAILNVLGLTLTTVSVRKRPTLDELLEDNERGR